MEPSDKRVWRCRICSMEMTPRCPVCRVVIGQEEAKDGQCATCRTTLPQTLADCPHCGAYQSLFFSPTIAYPQGLRGGLLAACRGGRILLAMAQMVGFLLFILSFAGVFRATAEGQTANPLPIREIALAVFLLPIPIQVFLGYAVFHLRRVPAEIGHHIGHNS